MRKVFTIILIFVSLTSFAQEGWTWLNPLPQGNLLNKVTNIPSTDKIIAVGDAGTIMISSDFGSSWDIKSSAGGAIGSLKDVYFFDANVGFAVGGGGTILKTIDGGNNWELKTSGTEYELSGIDFSYANTGLIVGKSGVVLQTNDGGETWNLKYATQNGAYCNFTGLYIVDGTNVIAYGNTRSPGTANNTNIWKSTDGGDTWQYSGFSNDVIYDMHFVNADSVLASSDGTVLFLTDTQGNWGSVALPVGIGGTNQFSFVDNNIGFVLAKYVQHNGYTILKTIDGGLNHVNSWNDDIGPAVSEDYQLTSIYFKDENNGIVVGNGMMRTTDSGQTWDTLSHSFTHYNLGPINFIDENTGFLAGTDGSGNSAVFKTTDASQSWTTVVDTALHGNRINDIVFIDNTAGFIVGSTTEGKPIIMRTKDGGITWDETMPSQEYYWFNSVDFINLSIGFAATGNGKIFKTTDGGDNWIEQNTGTSNEFFSISMGDENHGGVVSWGSVLITTDGGNSWENINTGYSGGKTDIQFVSPTVAYISGSDGKILKTTDGGTTWTILDTGITGYINDIFFPAEKVGYLNIADFSGNNSVWLTQDGGETWTSTGLTLPGDLHLFFTDINNGYAVGRNGWILKYYNSSITGIKNNEANQIPDKYFLSQNYPNPFNPTTTIKYSIPASVRGQSSFVQIKVYNALGSEAAVLVNSEQAPGNYTVQFNGSSLASGVYYLKMTSGAYFSVRKMLLLK